MKKFIILLLVLIPGLVLFASCSKEQNSGDIPGQTYKPSENNSDADSVQTNNTEAVAIELKVIKPSDMPETKKIESIDGKGLENYDTNETTPDIFFKSASKIRSAILANDGKIYFGNEDCEFYAVDIASKQTLWTYKTDVPVQSIPVFADGKIIFNAGNSLYILDAFDGHEIHKITYPAKSTFRVSDEPYAFNDSYVSVSDGVAYFASLDGDIVAVDIEKGNIVWTFEHMIQGEVASGVNLRNGKLYYTDGVGSLCCIDIQTQQMIFQSQIGEMGFEPMYISDGKVYIGGRSCKVYCIDAETGDVIWSSYSADSTTWFSGGCVSVGDALYVCVSDEHTVDVFNKNTGEFLRQYPVKLNAYTMPVLNGDNLIVAATDVYNFNKSYIMEFDTKGNTKLWEAPISDAVLSSPAVYQGVLYCGSDSGVVYSIDLH
ncbi:MAG: PQQ-binding-like beta-propeller repeat protein [Oscillospiraceae bacterium]|nr:PQQ-binding-like beta-propeller repeat protein [Oscillospiraceae bacterium]